MNDIPVPAGGGLYVSELEGDTLPRLDKDVVVSLGTNEPLFPKPLGVPVTGASLLVSNVVANEVES